MENQVFGKKISNTVQFNIDGQPIDDSSNNSFNKSLRTQTVKGIDSKLTINYEEN